MTSFFEFKNLLLNFAQQFKFTDLSPSKSFLYLKDGEMCQSTKYLLVEGLQGQNVTSLRSINQNVAALVLSNVTFSIFKLSVTIPLGNISYQMVPNDVQVVDPSIGYMDLNYVCNEVNVSSMSVEIIQEVVWSSTFKFFSIVKINNLPDNVLYTYDNSMVDIQRMGGNLYRLLYKEQFYLFQTLDTWSIPLDFQISQTLIINVPYKNKGNIGKNEIHNITIYPYSGSERYTLYSDIFGTLLSFKSTSNLENPVFSLGSLVFYTVPRPVYGKANNLTYIASCIPFKENGLNYTLYLQNNTQPSFYEYYNFLSNFTGTISQQTPNSIFSLFIDNSTRMHMVTSEYRGTDFKYGFKMIQLQYISLSLIFEFPFGFIKGNNDNLNFGFSIPIDDESVALINRISVCAPVCLSKLIGEFQPLITLPSTELGNIVIKSYSHVYIGNFNFLTRLELKQSNSSYPPSVSYISINTQSQVFSFTNEKLVSGTSSNGVWEYVTDISIPSQPFDDIDSSNIKITNSFDMNDVYVLSDEEPYSIENPFLTLSAPNIKLKNNNYLNDITNVSFLYNDIDMTDQPIDNIMFFSFKNIDDYRDLSIGFYLTDQKSLKDIGFENGVVLYLNPNYRFAVWDNTKAVFKVLFKVPANTLPGKISYSLVFNRRNSIDSNSLPKEFQLRATSSKIDIYGPIVSTIIKKQNGWVFTIKDEINGFKDGFLIVRGSIDSSTYNISINMSNLIQGSGDKFIGDYDIAIPLEFGAGSSLCVSQDFLITFASFFDTFGNNNTYFQYTTADLNRGIPTLDSTGNPFIHYINDSNAIKLHILCGGIVDNSPPNLIYFNSSRTSIDVGSHDRSITFIFQAQDLESGFKDNQNPIVYLLTKQIHMQQCVSRPIIKNFTTITYSCKIEVPVGFGYPDGFLISVYGFINNLGTYSGFSTKDIKDLNPLQQNWYVSTDFSHNIPIITSISEFTNQDSTLSIYGKSFSTINSAAISFTNGSSITLTTITRAFSSFIQIHQVPLIEDSFKLTLYDSNQPLSSRSNEFLINPINYKFNYSGPLYPPETTTSPPTKSPLPTNAPQKCLGIPECGGKDKGYCQNGIGCICYSPWYGTDCTSKIIIIPPPKTNTSDPTVIIPIPGNEGGNVTNSTEALFKSLVTLVSIRELGFNGEIKNTFPFDRWIFDEIGSGIGRYKTSISINNGNQIIITNITTIIQWFNSSKKINFAGQELQMSPSSVKFSIDIENFPFSSALNQLELVMFASLLSTDNSDDICSLKQFGNTSNGDNSNFIKLQVQDRSMYGRFIKRAIVDDFVVSVNNRLLDEHQNSIESSSHSTQTFIGIQIPHFRNKVTIDPDFSILLESKSASGEDSICSNKSDGLSKTKIAGIIIGSVAFVAIIVISVVYLVIKKRNTKKFKKSVQNKLKQLN
ncbi:hypothetical protein RB653_009592 [Dictyostelium firmibasis]|uniref:EGF-like domain-containing protein n=1 Tax=Dictyostelium firmibasis TaxID=79012 RepID=A0AAN7YQA7_9MYCE